MTAQSVRLVRSERRFARDRTTWAGYDRANRECTKLQRIETAAHLGSAMTKRQTYVPRKPRHQVSDGVDYTVELEFHEDERQSAHLADFSRNGCRLLVESPCFEGQIVTLRLELPQIRQRFELKSTICWTKEIEGQHSVGLVFQEDVPFEILGELILMGVIGEQ